MLPDNRSNQRCKQNMGGIMRSQSRCPHPEGYTQQHCNWKDYVLVACSRARRVCPSSKRGPYFMRCLGILPQACNSVVCYEPFVWYGVKRRCPECGSENVKVSWSQNKRFTFILPVPPTHTYMHTHNTHTPYLALTLPYLTLPYLTLPWGLFTIYVNFGTPPHPPEVGPFSFFT